MSRVQGGPTLSWGRLAAMAILATCCWLCLPAQSYAYVRSKSCIPGGSGPLACETGQEPVPLWWDVKCVYMHINELGTDQLPFDRVASIGHTSCDAWSSVSCSFMKIFIAGTTNEERVGYNPAYGAHGNANVIVFRDLEWPHPSPPPPLGDVLALTSTTYDFYSGELVDADIEFNTANYQFTANIASINSVIDLQNTLVHELGHVLGLDHSPVKDATMFDRAPVGETIKRTLEQDDIDGLCDMYPLANGTAFTCPAKPGFYDAPGRDIDDRRVDDGCCSISSRVKRTPNAGVLVWMTLLMGVLLRVRRRA